MSALIGSHKIANSILAGSKVKVLDPACGTGGFLVYLLQESIKQLREMLKERKITKKVFDDKIDEIKQNVFLVLTQMKELPLLLK